MIFPHLLVATALSRPKPIAIYYINKQVLRIYNVCLTVFVHTAITITILTPAFITTNNPALHKYTPEYHPDKNNNQSDNNNNQPYRDGTSERYNAAYIEHYSAGCYPQLFPALIHYSCSSRDPSHHYRPLSVLLDQIGCVEMKDTIFFRDIIIHQVPDNLHNTRQGAVRLD